MHSTWFSIDFLSFLKFPQIKEGETISSGKPIFQNDWIIQSPFLYFIFRKLKDSNSLSFFTFQCVLHDSVVLFSIIWDFLKLKGGPNFWGEANSAEGLRYLVPPLLLYFMFRNLKDPNSLSIIRFQWFLRNSLSFFTFQCVLHDSVVLFSVIWDFLKLKRGDLISWGEPILQNSWIIWSPLLCFNFRNFKHTNSSSFIRFQWVLRDSAVLFSLFWNYPKLKGE